MFTGIDTSFTRFRAAVPNPAIVDSLVGALAEARTVPGADPARVIHALGRAQRLLGKLCGPATSAPTGCPTSAKLTTAVAQDIAASRAALSDRINNALILASGLKLEATVPNELVAAGSSAVVSTTVWNPRKLRVETDIDQIDLGTQHTSLGDHITHTVAALPSDSVRRSSVTVAVPATEKGTRPYWLDIPRVTDMFAVPLLSPTRTPKGWVPGLIAEDARPSAGVAWAGVKFDSATAVLSSPIVAHVAGAAGAILTRPAAIAPAISITLDRTMDFAPLVTAYDRAVTVHLASAAPAAKQVSVALRLPPGLTADSAKRTVSVPAGGAKDLTFRVRGKLTAGTHTISAQATSGTQTFKEGYTLVDYPHIRPQRLYRDATLTVQAVDVAIPAGLTVAYIPGVGDNVPPVLQGFGLPITIVTPEQIASTDLTKFSTIVVGPRAYDSSPVLVANNPKLFDYVKNGGTMVVQYGQNMNRPGVMPFAVGATGNADRVTEEDSPVIFLNPASPLLTTPNKIGPADFSGWVQERATYMPRPGARDSALKPIIAMNDTGEKPLDGGVLVAPYGKGTYVYVTLVLFRELPAGVPGAARIFMNLVAAGHPITPIRPLP